MLKAKPFTLGILTGTIYDFSEVGDILPMHSHTESDVHITVVAKGVFVTRGIGWQRSVKAGDVLNWRPNEPHEFIADEAESRIVNIVKA
jgi:quercetin dioxygenase-like cupin family protein